MILGLDISTSSTGVCVINDSKIEYVNYFCPTGDDIYSKIDSIKSNIDDIFKNFKITKIFVEEPLIRMGGKFSTSADTLKMLIRFNFAMCYYIYEKSKIRPVYVPFSSARKILELKKVEIKEESLSALSEHVHLDKLLACQYSINKFPSFKNTLFVDKNFYSKGKNKGLPKNCIFDCSDAVIIAVSGEQYVKQTSNT